MRAQRSQRRCKQTGSTSTTCRGYYLVRSSDGERFFVSKDVNNQALDDVAKRALSDVTGWNYWIDQNIGLDVHGRAAWVNLDMTDHFLV